MTNYDCITKDAGILASFISTIADECFRATECCNQGCYEKCMKYGRIYQWY